MLKKLTVQNYILIDNLEIEFSNHFSVLTGETGSGKSILLGAIGLVLGNRADTTVVKNLEQKCVVEAIFDIKDYNLKEIFEQNQIDYETESVFRREITPQGKSRAFINDTPVNLNTLKEIGSWLVDIHSQHETLNLSERQFQLQIVDTVAQNNTLLEQYQIQWHTLNEIEQQVRLLEGKNRQIKEKYDYTKFQYEQLKNAKISEGEIKELEIELNQLTHSEQIKTGLAKTIDILDNEDFGIIKNLKQLDTILSTLTEYIPTLTDKLTTIESARIEFQETLRELTHLNENLEFDPQRQEQIQSRLNLLYNLLSKHHRKNETELLELQHQLEAELNYVDNFEHQIAELKKQQQQQIEIILQIANEISQRREKVFFEIENYIADVLKSLGMPSVQFKVENTKSTPTSFGIDNIRFLFSSNKQVAPGEISKVASGGELSRIMLAIKSLLATRQTLPTIIFDEIDTGISGEIADKMAKIMATMAQNMQVISISHLPQIAAKAQTHYLVYKVNTENTTHTHIRKLSHQERVLEIARMLSGEQLGQAAIENAKELLSN